MIIVIMIHDNQDAVDDNNDHGDNDDHHNHNFYHDHRWPPQWSLWQWVWSLVISTIMIDQWPCWSPLQAWRSLLPSMEITIIITQVSLPRTRDSSLIQPPSIVNGIAVSKTFQILYRNEEVILWTYDKWEIQSRFFVWKYEKENPK